MEYIGALQRHDLSLVALQEDHLSCICRICNDVQDCLRGSVVLDDDALLFRTFVIFVEELVQEVLEIRRADLAHDHQMRHVLVHLFKPSSCPGRLTAKQCHELTRLRWQDKQDAEKQEGQEDLAIVGGDLRSVPDERHRDEDEIHHLEISCVLSDEVRERVQILQIRAYPAWEHNDGQHDVDNIENVTRGVYHHVVDDALRQVDTAQIKHDACAEEAISVLGPTKDPHEQEGYGRDDFHH